ncbi:MAG TPA: DegV family protein [Dehalococcoidia bacterium]|nr:DegV family protein [Dehalococcoidia bacterium]
MTVKIVTDSTADISPELAEEMGVRIVPVYLRFGTEIFRDGVDITKETFYSKLKTSPLHPSTSQPTPQDFAEVYSDCANEAEGIVSIHVSSKVSGTYNAALQGGELQKYKCQVEVVDSQLTSMGLGLVVMAAARLARAGESVHSVLEETNKAIGQVRMLGLFDTMKYLVRGGRISKATGSVAKILNIKPLFTFKEGEIVRTSLARTYSQGVAKLYQFASSLPSVQELAIAYSTVPAQAERLKEKLLAVFPDLDIHISQLGAGLGVHGGPGVLLIALR